MQNVFTVYVKFLLSRVYLLSFLYLNKFLITHDDENHDQFALNLLKFMF